MSDPTDTSDKSKKSVNKMFKEFQGDKAFPDDLAELFDGCEDSANDERQVLSVRAERNLEDL